VSASPAAPVATPAATAVAPAASDRAPADAGTAPAGKGLGAVFGWGQPPTGRPMNEVKRLDSPSIGIPLPIAGPASAAADGAAQGK
jgi:hypothetical protein